MIWWKVIEDFLSIWNIYLWSITYHSAQVSGHFYRMLSMHSIIIFNFTNFTNYGVNFHALFHLIMHNCALVSAAMHSIAIDLVFQPLTICLFHIICIFPEITLCKEAYKHLYIYSYLFKLFFSEQRNLTCDLCMSCLL